MKKFMSSVLVMALTFSVGATALAAGKSGHRKTSTKSTKTSAQRHGGSKLSRDVVFDGSVVNGKYLAAGEAVSTVESEKSLGNLIGLRADFKDRLAAERQRLKRGTQGDR